MYVGPFVAAWEKIRWISDRFSGRELLLFGKKIAILLSTAMILTGSCVSSVAVHAQTGYAAEYAQEASAARRAEHCKACCRRAPRKQSCLPVVLQWKPADTGKRGG